VDDAGAVGRVDRVAGRWQARFDAPDSLLDLYLPVCGRVAGRPRLLGHLGQSIDGYIATASGDSNYVNDPANIVHLHRLRALHDAVVVGAGTIAADDPQLTTRHVAGPSPVRVVLDPRRRLPVAAGVFNDDEAPTLLVVADSSGGQPRHGHAEVLFIPVNAQGFVLEALIDALAERGLRRIFVEGGGTTVSHFQDAAMLDRLQIAIAPVLIGQGAPGLRLAPKVRLQDCTRPVHRTFAMGQDILFDCDLRAGQAAAVGSSGGAASRS
jgi:riboflavin-specific deaminase-like protein